MKMRWMMVPVLGMTLMASGADGAPGARQVTAGDLSTGAVVVVGELGKPLGRYVTVEGDYSSPGGKNETLLHVDKLEGEATKSVISIHVENRLKDAVLAGRRYRLRGYETGGMEGDLLEDPKNPRTQEQKNNSQPSVNSGRLRWVPRFFVTGIEDLGPVKAALK